MKNSIQKNRISYRIGKVLNFCVVFFLLTSMAVAQHATNPVIPGFNPDPSVCRVGDDFYLVTSTFEYFPGVPVYHSKDLINWEMIGHAIHDTSQIDYSNVSSTAGIYAPTIRYHDGLFYMITTFVGGTNSSQVAKTGNFIMTAKDPKGPWSKPHWIDNAPGIDPSLFFDDDGKVYYCGNRHPEKEEYRAQRQIWIQEIDIEEFKLKGPIGLLKSKPYYEKDIIGNPVAFEAPHIYKKDGVYYLLIAHGGTGAGHAVSIWKSDSPLGPWEMNPQNPILTHRRAEPSGISSTGHADIFETQDGDWYSVFLAVRSTDRNRNVMGRETFLTPVDWSGEWPIFNPKKNPGKTQLKLDPTPRFQGKQRSFNFFDDFKSETLSLDWTFIRQPKSEWWSLDAKSGSLSIALQPDVIENYSHPAFMGVRVIEMKASFETVLDFTPHNETECAGLAFLRGHQPSWTLVKEKLNGQLTASVYYTDSLVSSVDLKSDSPLHLKIELDDFFLSFFVKEEGKQWHKITGTDGSELAFPPAGRFTGSFAGVYASSRGGDSQNKAKFAYYRMQGTR
jgi:alpha-N-arabinofuranosidase